MLLILHDCQDLNSRLLLECLSSLPCPAMILLINVEHRLPSTLESRMEGVAWFLSVMGAGPIFTFFIANTSRA